jgi:CheY-like chemotaxis protein
MLMIEEASRRAQAVLVVEDDSDVRDAVVEALRDSGRTALGARDGSHALQLIECGEIPRPCLVLLDWIMAPMSGEEFLRQIGERPDAADFPIVVTTAGARLEFGATRPNVLGTLRKPLDLNQLLGAVSLFCDGEVWG